MSVYNSGSHIPDEDLDQVWEKFFKVDKARTREYGGSGVGLSIVRAIMESFHQDFGVRNVEDGVEFWFELDYAGSKEPSALAAGRQDSGAESGMSSSEGRKERRAREAAEKEALKRMKKEMQKEDEAVDAEWVSTSRLK